MTFGYKLIVTPDVQRPKMQLSARVCEVLSKEFVAETNGWMLRFFGTRTENILEDGAAVILEQEKEIHMNPRTYEQFLLVTRDYRG